ncbi:MazG nucleotide pyrophosphohydrolase [Bacillus pseudomycoides]|nr:MazG nucleotide pyrophosphohydrolase [Bacillus pseudomycoides]
MNFLTEEVGEVSRVVRAIEIGRDRPDEQVKQVEELKIELKEELGDVLANLIILSQKYDLDLQDIMEAHVEKLSNRFGNK